MQGQVDAFIDTLQGQGRYSFAKDDLRREVSLSRDGLGAALRRIESSGKLVRPSARGTFFVIVPPEFRTIGVPPLSWWLDAFMVHLEHPEYYVGLVTAAEWHGSAHYAAQESQVVVSAQLRPLRIGRQQLRFVTKSTAAATSVMRRSSEGGSVRVSTPEATAVDLVRYSTLAGGLSRIATILSEMPLSPRELRDALEVAGDVTAAQRLGYLLQAAGQRAAARAVARYVTSREHRIRPLDPTAPTRDAAVASPWGVAVNASVEVG